MFNELYDVDVLARRVDQCFLLGFVSQTFHFLAILLKLMDLDDH